MSADNWTICPKCHDKHAEEIIKREEALAKAYGVVKPEEYIRQLQEFNDFKKKPEQTTLREDYEQGIVDGEYYLNYSGSCSVCGWNFKKKIEEVVYKSKYI